MASSTILFVFKLLSLLLLVDNLAHFKMKKKFKV